MGSSVPTLNQPEDTQAPAGSGRRDVHGDDLPSIQVQRRIEADILTGRLKAGSRLAPERELGARLGVARNTLRRALSALGEKGLIQARGRGGWVVVGPGVTERIEGPPSLTEWAARHGYVVTSNVIAGRVRTVTAGEAADLRIPTSSKVYELERVRFIEVVPLSASARASSRAGRRWSCARSPPTNAPRGSSRSARAIRCSSSTR
jgi:DNA-binding GntR family transcriptional regulator